MTKAERIFKDTWYECAKHIKVWGYSTNPDGSAVGFNTVIYKDNETVCTRTMNEVGKLIERDRKRWAQSYRLGVLTADEYEIKMQILNMVESTVRNTREMLKRLHDMITA